MGDLLPKLEPIKAKEGQFHDEFSSLYQLQYYKSGTDRETTREAIRFSIAIANTGKGELHIILGDEKNQNGEIIAPAKQRVYKDNGEFREVDVGYFEKHMHEDSGGTGGHNHPHWHYAGLASLDLLDKEDHVVASCKKTSYCVVDVFKYKDMPNSPKDPKFSTRACINKNDVGISVGWADYYRPEADGQYIEIDRIKSGTYSIRFKVNRTHLTVDESQPITIRINIDKEKGEVKPVEKEE
jgi:hypothetical protein